MGLPIGMMSTGPADETVYYTTDCGQSPWVDEPSENDATEAAGHDSIYVYEPMPHDGDPSIEWMGQLRGPYYDEVRAFAMLLKTRAKFDQARGATTNPDDPRWHCHAWMRSVHGLMDEIHDALAPTLHLERDAFLLIPPNNDAATLLWATPSGGFLAFLNHHSGACGWCLGCRSFVRAREQAPVSWVYFVQGTDGGPVKIGRSASPVDRLSSLQTANPARLRIVAKLAGGGAVERAMHVLFAADRIRPDGEWFRPSQALAAFMREIGGAK